MLETNTSAVTPDLLAPFRLEPFGATRGRTPGVTAVLRLEEETALQHSLPPLLRAVSRVIVVDHGTGRTGRDTAVALAAEAGASERLRVLDYPFELATPGHAHLDTPPDHTRSRVHFHNWAFSHARTTFALRWDSRLVLTPGGESLLADLDWQVGRHQATFRLPRHPLYVESDQVGYLDLAWANVTQCGHPVAPGYSYVKGFDRELLRLPRNSRHHGLPLGSCLLLRTLDDPGAQASTSSSPRSPDPEARRARYEADTIRAILAGRWQERPSLHRLEAPPGTHVVDHAAAHWSAP